MSDEEETFEDWETLDESMTKLQTWEHIMSEAREQIDTLRHTIAQTLEREGGHTYHGDVGTATLVHTRKVLIDEAQKQAIFEAYRTSVYTTLVPQHYELTPVFMDHARDGVFSQYGVQVTTSTSVRITYHAKKEKKNE